MKHRTMATIAAGTLTFGTVIAAALAVPAAQGAVPRYTIIEKSFVVQPATSRNFTIYCPTGRIPVGGGGHAGQGSFFGDPGAGIYASDISLHHRGWTVSAFVGASFGPTSFTADVVCATP